MGGERNIAICLRERGGQTAGIDFSSVANLLVAGGSAADRQTIFDAVSRQVPPDRVYTIGRDDIDGAEYDLIDITRIALADYKRTDSTDAALQERFVIIEDLAPLLKADEGFFTESVLSLAVMADRARLHVIAGLGDTWRSALSENLRNAFAGRVAFRCENAQGYRVVLGRTVKNPPQRGEFYYVEKDGRTRLCSLAAADTIERRADHAK